MQKQTQNDISGLFRAIAKLEADLRVLRRKAAEMAAVQYAKKPGSRRSKDQFKSLRGVFPHSDTTMEDFRDARRSWTRNLEREP